MMRSPIWMRALPLAAALLLGGGLLARPAALALAPAFTEPPAGETVGEAPEVIVITFDERLALEPGVNSVAVLDAEGQRVDDGQAAIAGYSPRTLIVRLNPAVEPEGALRVVYVVQSAESGRTLQGEFSFTVEPGAAPAAEAEAAVEEDAAGGRSEQDLALWTVGILLGSAVTAYALYQLRVVTGNARSSVEHVQDAPHH